MIKFSDYRKQRNPYLDWKDLLSRPVMSDPYIVDYESGFGYRDEESLLYSDDSKLREAMDELNTLWNKIRTERVAKMAERRANRVRHLDGSYWINLDMPLTDIPTVGNFSTTATTTITWPND